MIQATDKDTIRQGVEQFGIAPGAQALMDLERDGASRAIESGMYIVYRMPSSSSDCTRVGPRSKCFCGHLFSEHSDRYPGKCMDCACNRFRYVPIRPEEVGEWWLPRREEFNILSYKVKCRCGHATDEHHPVNTRCARCRCCMFESDFLCVSCDSHWEEHDTVWEDEYERQRAGRAVGMAFMPLASTPDIQRLVFDRAGRRPSRFVKPRIKK